MVAFPAVVKYQWPYVTLADFNGGPDATAAANSAAVASAIATGLPIVIPPSDTTYKLASPFEMTSGLRMQGFGGRYSVFEAATDFGAGQYLFYANLATIDTQDGPIIRGIGGRGVGTRLIGTAPCQMDGIALTPKIRLEDCTFSYFNSAIKVLGDHNSLINVNAEDSYYCIDFADEKVSSGNTIAIGCGFGGALMASIKVGASNGIDASTFIQCHLGYSPFGILRVGTNPTGPGINNSEFIGCSFEAIGNSAIRDESTGGTVYTLAGTSFSEVGFSRDASYNYASKDKDYACKFRTVADSEIKISRSPFSPGDVATYQFTENGDLQPLVLHLNDSEAPPTVVGYGTGITWGRPAGQRGAYAKASVAIGDREAVELTSGYPLEVAKNGTVDRPFYGIAQQAAASPGDMVAVQTHGRARCLIGAVAVGAGGVLLRPDSANKHKLVPVGSLGLGGATFGDSAATGIPSRQPIVGASARDYTASSNGEVILSGAPSMDPGFDAPAYVAALPTASETYRGQKLTIVGGAGVADVTYVCLKSAGDTYSWKTVSTG